MLGMLGVTRQKLLLFEGTGMGMTAAADQAIPVCQGKATRQTLKQGGKVRGEIH